MLREDEVADEEVGVVDEIGFELGDTEFAGVGGDEGEVEVELIGAFALEGTGAEGDFAVGGIGVFAGESVGFVDFVASSSPSCAARAALTLVWVSPEQLVRDFCARRHHRD